jgi:phage-related protein
MTDRAVLRFAQAIDRTKDSYQISSPFPVLILIKLELTGYSGATRFAKNPESISFENEIYNPSNLEISFSEFSRGTLPSMELALPNIDLPFSDMLRNSDKISGSINIFLFNPIMNGKFDTTREPDLSFIYEIEEAFFDDHWARFQLSLFSPTNRPFPGVFFRPDCNWKYKDPATCQYTGALASCDFSLLGANGCKAHNNVLHFGGYPGISVVKGFTGGVVNLPPPVAPITVEIQSPTTNPTYTTATNSVTLAGIAAADAGLAEVTWANDKTSGSGVCSGTSSWNSGSISLDPGINNIRIRAFDIDNFFAEDQLSVRYSTAGSDVTDPLIAITHVNGDPVVGGAASVSTETADIDGTADGTGSNIESIVWKNSQTGATGEAPPVASWSVNDIALNLGDNSITFTITDEAGLTASDTVTITTDAPTLQPPPVVEITSPALDNGDSFETSALVVALAGTATSNNAIASVKWESKTQAGALINFGNATGTTSWSANVFVKANSTSVITITATDSEGIMGSISVSAIHGTSGGGGTPLPAPTITAVVPSTLVRGQSLGVSISGTNFQGGAKADFGAGITTLSTNFISSSSLTASIAVGLSATLGPRNLIIINPDNQSASFPIKIVGGG